MVDPKILDLRKKIQLTSASAIALTSTIEYQMQLTIASQFTDNNEDYKLFSSLFFSPDSGIFFKRIIKILERLLEKKYPQFLKKNPKFIKDLYTIGDYRNKFAHSFIPDNDTLRKIIGKNHFILGYLEGGVITQHKFAWNEIKEKLLLMKNIVSKMEEIQKLQK